MQHIHTDQGRECESKILQIMCKMLGVNKTRTTSYHPQSDGWVERCNRRLKDILAKLINSSQKDRDVCIPHVLFVYRTAVHASIGVTPDRMLYGREVRIPVDLLVIGVTASDEVPTDVPTYLQKMNRMFARAYDMARMKLKKSTQRYRDYYDSKANGKSFKVGDEVQLFQAHSRKGISRKLSRSWEGPYTVMKALSDAVYRVQKDGKDRKLIVVHFNQLKRCFANSREPSQIRARPKEQRISLVKVQPEFTVQARDHDSTDEEEELVEHDRRLYRLRLKNPVPLTYFKEKICR